METKKIEQKQLIDYFLIEEIINGRPIGYGSRIANKVSNLTTDIKPNKVYTRAKKVISGKCVLKPAADLDGQPTPRTGKDLSYEGFWALVDIHLPDRTERTYVGLAANQLGVVRDRVSSQDPLIVCENKVERMEKWRALSRHILSFSTGSDIFVIQDDVFNFLKQTKNTFNIYDLDLMCSLPKTQQLNKWAEYIYQSAKEGTTVLYLTVCIGRNITEQEHNLRLAYLCSVLNQQGFRNSRHSYSSYRDRYMPMRSIKMVMEK